MPGVTNDGTLFKTVLVTVSCPPYLGRDLKGIISPVIIAAMGGLDPPKNNPFKGFSSPCWSPCVILDDFVGEPGIGGKNGGVVD